MISFQASGQVESQFHKQAELAWDQLQQRQDLGFMKMPERIGHWQLAQQAGQQLRRKAEKLIVLGLGGSAMGGQCLVETLGERDRVQFLYNTDPTSVRRVLDDSQNYENTHFLVISKSGGTLEIACLLDILIQRFNQHKKNLKDCVSVVTELKDNSLHAWAKNESLHLIEHPVDVGGRFSVFTSVGLIPATFAGLDLAKLRQGAQLGLQDKGFITDLAAYFLSSFSRGESISAFWLYAEELNSFAPWLLQLWAESLGKKVKRTTSGQPVVSTPVAYSGTCDQHSVLQQLMEGAQDKSIGFIRKKNQDQHFLLSGVGLPGFQYLKNKSLGDVFHVQSCATQEALNAAGRSTWSLELSQIDEASLGRLLISFQLLIGVLGEALDLNAFDQPGVELGKKITKEKLQ